MRLGERRTRPDGTAFWDVMVALSVLLGVGLVLWIWGVLSTVPMRAQYPRPGWGAFWDFWAGNADPTKQPLSMFALTLFLLSVYLFVLFVTNRGTRRRRRLWPERLALTSGFALIVGMGMVMSDITDIVNGRYSLTKWEGTIFGFTRAPVPETFILPMHPDYDPRRFWAKIGDEWAFVVDADTLRIDGKDYRLWGVDALQKEQLCPTEEEWRRPCGEKAREVFVSLMRYAPPSQVHCFYPDQAHYPGTISCRAGGLDVAKWMVRRGYAFPTETGRHRYEDARRTAEANKWGAWGATFLYPWKWREARCQYTFAGRCIDTHGDD